MKTLIIDDSKAILTILSDWFKERNYEVLTATSGIQGLKLFAQHDLDMVVLDVEMPGMNGFQVAHVIRNVEEQWTPIIFMSGAGKESYYKKGIDAGGDFYFTKPLNLTMFDAFISGVERMYCMRKELLKSNTELTSLLENTHDGIVSFDKQGQVLKINKSCERILSSTDFSSAVNILEILKPMYGEAHTLNSLDLTNGSIENKEAVYRYDDHLGTSKLIEMSVTSYMCDGKLFYTGIVRDITERKITEKKLKYLAQYDTLTGLPNRALFSDRLEQSLLRAQRAATLVSLLFIDLDKFKVINDTLGHNVGDKLLYLVSERIKNNIRKCDTAARLGGDEFVVIIDDFTEVRNLITVSEKLLACFEAPFLIESHELFVTISMGVAVTSEYCTDSETLIKHADLAMYRAKENGRNQLQFFTDKLNSKNLYRMELSNELHHAVKKSELSIHYQPQLNLTTKEIIGAEALLRWNNPQAGLVSPGEFIPLLEENGLIIPVTEWLIHESFHQWKSWERQGIVSHCASLSINISAKHFVNHSLVNILSNALKHFNLIPQNLVIEITESAMMANKALSRSVLNKISNMGVTIALDDFGTGFSSLSYLSQFPIDHIKIDKSFVDKINNKQEDRELILAIINMARCLNMKVIAEGVDSKEKLDFLQNSQCDYYQGFLFSKALSVPDFKERLAKYCQNGFVSIDNVQIEEKLKKTL
ncbi:EAL domain-containing protein [Vibrio sp. S4M6]|uniref:EAL domain-containing protein n=1 Tax=Vibrio sinus TaxID=2946865 RepID=UPI00202A5556|nr:EAL domain-containing protein [Vibrio sinus]MCL9781743.1 EAL domain-containing protein [Vibrio sinus]